jgi:1L-myo-inositol 1-phosphate cytidylyltransferase
MTNDSGLSSHASISEAVVLMAGSGSRLRANGISLAKPLIPIQGRPLISYTIDALIHAGIRTVHAVVGFESDTLMARLRPLVPASLDLRFVINHDWKKQNGISVLAAANQVNSPFLLTMSDHVFDESIIDLLVRNAVFNQLNLAIDRKVDSTFDLDDAMKIRTRADRVVAIGKDLKNYDAIDTGLFICPLDVFQYLEQAKRSGDCALADGVRLMAADNKVRAIDIGDAWWQDVDTPEMLASAEKHLQSQIRRHPTAAKMRPPTQA